MSDKKQSSVEWLVKIYLQTKKIDSFDIEQAKAMHKQEITKTYDDAIMKGRQEDGNEYYNETYGGNNEQHETEQY